jgi:hypothetical protein
VSGQCTGWVLRHGPKNRAQRAVLLTIADAANRDGQHAHPGRQAMVEGSLYSATTVDRIVADLIRLGWLEVESEGGGRGRATVYRVPMDKKAPHDGEVYETSPFSETSPSERETSPPERETSPRRAPDQDFRAPNGLYGLSNVAGVGEPSGPPPATDGDETATRPWAFDRNLIDQARGVLRGERGEASA